MAVATLPDLALRSHHATWDYEQWEQLPNDGNRYEVIHGVLYMTTVPSNFHQWIVRRLDRLVGIPLEDRGLAYVFTAPIGVLMPGCDPVQPDFVVVLREHADIIYDRRIRGVPDLLVEVLSPNNAEQDTEIKRVAYAQAGVPEYWIVLPNSRTVLVYSEPDVTAGDYAQVQQFRASEACISPTLPVRVAVADLFAGAPDTTL